MKAKDLPPKVLAELLEKIDPADYNITREAFLEMDLQEVAAFHATLEDTEARLARNAAEHGKNELMKTDEREILSLREAARFLGLSVAHTARVSDGRVKGTPPIPHARAGRRRLFRRTVLVQWLEEQERAMCHDILSPTRINACVSEGNHET